MDDANCLTSKLERLEIDFHVTSGELKSIALAFKDELRAGLQKKDQNLAMMPSWLTQLPSGSECGQYLTIDLGGTNLRICWVELGINHKATCLFQSAYKIPDIIKTSTADKLWCWVVESLEEFVLTNPINHSNNRLKLGFTFSFPMEQTQIDQGILKAWTKGFDISGADGADVADQFREALSKSTLPIDLVAITNDTVGTLVASYYHDPQTIIGCIFGTGSNAAYMETVEAIMKLETNIGPRTEMAINCEYGAFDNAHMALPRTAYDQTIDSMSVNPGEQTYEKMVAGLYLGEIFRLILLDFSEEGFLLRHCKLEKLHRRHVLDASCVSIFDEGSQQDATKEFFDLVDIELNDKDYQVLQRIARIIATRGARLAACGVAAICSLKGYQSGHVAVDGSLATKSLVFRTRWAQALGQILEWPDTRPEDPIIMTKAEDGSTMGAAIIAAMLASK